MHEKRTIFHTFISTSRLISHSTSKRFDKKHKNEFIFKNHMQCLSLTSNPRRNSSADRRFFPGICKFLISRKPSVAAIMNECFVAVIYPGSMRSFSLNGIGCDVEYIFICNGSAESPIDKSVHAPGYGDRPRMWLSTSSALLVQSILQTSLKNVSEGVGS